MQIYAHRGYSGKYPENTMIAFQKAVEAGVFGIELDVQLARDGVPVIIHDETLERTTDGVGFVKDHTAAELSKLSIVDIYNKEESLKIPTLEEYLNYIKDKNVVTNIELKTSVFYYTGIEQRVIDLVRKYDLTDMVSYSSFNHETLQRVLEIDKNSKIGFLVVSNIIDVENYLLENNAYSLNAVFTYYLDINNVRRLHENGIKAFAWTVNGEQELAIMRKNGVDVAITNYPEMALLKQK